MPRLYSTGIAAQAQQNSFSIKSNTRTYLQPISYCSTGSVLLYLDLVAFLWQITTQEQGSIVAAAAEICNCPPPPPHFSHSTPPPQFGLAGGECAAKSVYEKSSHPTAPLGLTQDFCNHHNMPCYVY